MKAAYKREKGRKLELAFAKLLRKIDPKAKRMPLSGAGASFGKSIANLGIQRRYLYKNTLSL